MAEYKKIRNNNIDGIIDDKTAFENEKNLLQRSAVLAEQRASGLQELWRSCKADLATARANASQAQALYTAEKTRVRQLKEENTELQEKIFAKDGQIKKLFEEIENLKTVLLQLRKEISTKDDSIQSLQREKSSFLLKLTEKDKELNKKDVELHYEMLKTEQLNEKVEQLANEIQKLQARLDKWPFNFTLTWGLSSNISALCSSLATNAYQRMLHVASIFHLV